MECALFNRNRLHQFVLRQPIATRKKYISFCGERYDPKSHDGPETRTLTAAFGCFLAAASTPVSGESRQSCRPCISARRLARVIDGKRRREKTPKIRHVFGPLEKGPMVGGLTFHVKGLLGSSKIKRRGKSRCGSYLGIACEQRRVQAGTVQHLPLRREMSEMRRRFGSSARLRRGCTCLGAVASRLTARTAAAGAVLPPMVSTRPRLARRPSGGARAGGEAQPSDCGPGGPLAGSSRKKARCRRKNASAWLSKHMNAAYAA